MQIENAPTSAAERILAELEDSIPQGQPNDTGLRRRADDIQDVESDFADLDQFLADSLHQVDQDKQYKADRKAAANGYSGMTKEEVEFCNSRMRAFEMARVWEADKTIAVFRRYCCDTCGQYLTVFHQYMEHHKHRHNATASRWISTLEAKFPPEPVLEVEEVPFCQSCAASEYGISLRNMRSLEEVINVKKSD